jgi:hypothetical protein
LIIVFDAGEKGWNVVERNTGGDSASGNSHPVTHEQVAISAGNVVEVDVAIERSADCPQVASAPGAEQQLGDAAAELMVFGIGESGGAQIAKHRGRRGEVGDALR